MKSIQEQLEIVYSLIGNSHKIDIKEDGFMSRGFVIDNGNLIFKFPRNKDVDYKTEIDNLNLINSLDLGINLQKVVYVSNDNSYLGIKGVLGKSLEEIKLDKNQKCEVGKQLGEFLKKLHNTKINTEVIYTLKSEIEAWQNRVVFVNDFITKTFSEKEQKTIYKLMFEYMPSRLKELGEILVYSHGDLGDGNIFVDNAGKVGIIDFSESGLLDEAADFMDIDSDEIRQEMLNVYGANNTLREKVEIRMDIRPFIVLKPYLTRNNGQVINELINKIRKILNKYENLLID